METIEKTALVTGASRGIGRAIALTLAAKGYAVALNYAGSQAAAEAVKGEIEAAGGKAFTIQGDVSKAEDVDRIFKTIKEEFGQLDVLVNNAGITRDDLLMRMSEEDFDAVMDTNLKGTFHTIRHMSRYFLKQKSGKIINMSSVSGILGNAGQANYSASKAGVIGLTKSVARELASRRINVNAIAPGFIATDMTDAMTEEAKEKIAESIPFKRIGQPEEIAEMALFLASDKSDYITGQVFAVDGGMTI